jgi:N-methylhydantoinase A
VPYRISTDIGGTFTDLVLADERVLIGRWKSPSTPRDLAGGIFDCLHLVARDLGLSLKGLLRGTELFVHGSTVATNAILEGKGAKCGVLCTRGTKYTLWRGEGRRRDIFNFQVRAREPLVRPHLCLEVTERIDRDGQILIPLEEDGVRSAIHELRDLGCEALAVCLLWSVRNPTHERRIRAIVEEERPGVPLSLSSEIQPVLREYHRMSCVALNAMLQPVVARYLGNLERRLAESGYEGAFLVVSSDGGVLPVEEVARRPVLLLFSGPATGPSAGLYFANAERERSCLVIDMGGTSFDVSTVVDGRITRTKDGRILDHPTGVSSVEILTLGAGGGSIASVDRAGMLLVGPRSAGAEPGPACYLRGGTEPTVTDAYVVLGYVLPDRFLGGRMRISADAAREAVLTKVAKPLRIPIERAALGICQVVREKMVNGILDMTVRRGIDPRELVIVTGGGATSVSVARLAMELGCRRVLIPRETSVLCAFGSLNADILLANVASLPTTSAAFDFDSVNRTLEALDARGQAFLENLGLPSERRETELHAAARYPMQVRELEVPLRGLFFDEGTLRSLVADFHSTHRTRYKTADLDSDVEFVMWRHTARGIVPKVDLPELAVQSRNSSAALLELRPAYIEEKGAFADTPVFDADRVLRGMEITGPAMVVAPDNTILVPPRCQLRVGSRGYFSMDVADQRATT